MDLRRCSTPVKILVVALCCPHYTIMWGLIFIMPFFEIISSVYSLLNINSENSIISVLLSGFEVKDYLKILFNIMYIIIKILANITSLDQTDTFVAKKIEKRISYYKSLDKLSFLNSVIILFLQATLEIYVLSSSFYKTLKFIYYFICIIIIILN